MRPGRAADLLAAARRDRALLAPFTDEHPDLDEAWAYDVQDADLARRTSRSEQVVGAKLGLTSVAKQRRMQVDRPIVGFLTDAMQLPADVPVDLAASGWVQPRAEPEIAFLLGHDLGTGPGRPAAGRDEVAACVAAVAVAVEVIDSRYRDYRFRLSDVVADNTSAAGFVLGPWLDAKARLDELSTVPCTLAVDGRDVAAATGAAILGDPLHALARLAAHAASRGRPVPAGSVVLAGAMTDAVPLLAGQTVSVRSGFGDLVLTARG